MRTDIQLDDNFELRIENGDIMLDLSDAQNQQLIIKSAKGNFLQYPTLGVGIDMYLNGSLEQFQVKIKKDIKLNFDLDGYLLLDFDINDSEINYTARLK